MNKAKITYRFNHEKKHLQEMPKLSGRQAAVPLHSDQPAPQSEPVIRDTQPLNQFTNDFGAWSSPFEVETEKLEALIRDEQTAQSSSHAAIEKQHQEHEGPDISELIAAKQEKKMRVPAWGKLLFSASAAVFTGLMLGVFILNMFTTSFTVPPQSNNPAPVTVPTDSDTANAGEQSDLPNANDENLQPGVPVISTVNIPSKQYYFLQNGVFSTEESAKQAQLILEKNGFASVIDGSDGYRVYAGFSNNRDEALFLGRRIEQRDLETFIKTVDRAAITHIAWPAGDAAVFTSYMNGSAALIDAMNGWTSQLLRADAAGLTGSQLERLKELHQTWSAAAVEMSASISDEHRSMIGKMNASMNTAVESMAEYAKNPNDHFLWQAQTEMMNYILLEKAFISEMTP